MDSFYDRLINRAATIDELLSDDFEAIPGEQDRAGFGQRRLAAWCQSAASGDWSLFGRRIERDGLDSAGVLARLTAVRRKPTVPIPLWAADATWILPALEGTTSKSAAELLGSKAEPVAFEHLLAGVVERAEALLQSGTRRQNGRKPDGACVRLPAACASYRTFRVGRPGVLRTLCSDTERG